MTVIFLDFEGVLTTVHASSWEDIERRIKILSDITKEFNCKIVIEASAKDAIDEETLYTESEWIKKIFYLFKKYNIECIGRTPNVIRRLSKISYLSMWKEDEILMYLYNHPEIEHFCVIDDDDRKTLYHQESDLDKVREYLVTTLDFCKEEYEKEGLLKEHKDEISQKLSLNNRFKDGYQQK